MLNNLSQYLKKEKYRISILSSGVHILNYQTLLDITDKEVLIKIEDKLVKIEGKDLILVELDKFELLVKGNIKRVEING